MTSNDRILVCLPDRRLRDTVGDIDGVEFTVWDWDSTAPFNRADIIVPPYMSKPTLLGRLQGVTARLVQSQSIGYDGVADVLPAGLPFAIASTVHETSTAELTLALILAMQRGIPQFVRSGDRAEWAPAMLESLADRRVLIVGAGGVGRAIAARLAPFETEVTMVARTARSTADGPVHAMSELPTLLPDADIVVLAVPLSDETRQLADDAFLSQMNDGALLVNVARGPVVDTDALVTHLTAGRIRAAVDVTDPEPLPADHALWRCPNLLVSPHVGGASTAMLPRMARLIRRQAERILAGEPPINVVIDG